jgi:hypothetical protein
LFLGRLVGPERGTFRAEVLLREQHSWVSVRLASSRPPFRVVRLPHVGPGPA